MSLNAGQSLHPNSTNRESRVAAEAIGEGDAVALDSNGELVAADGTDNPTVYGIAGYKHTGDGYDTGEYVEVIFQGFVVGNVAGGTGAGIEVGASATDGELAEGSTAKGILTAYAEGTGPETVPTGTAHLVL